MPGHSISFPSRKGGSGKSGATASVAEELGRKKLKVLVCDCDESHSTSNRMLAGSLSEGDPTIYDVMVNGAKIGDAIYPASKKYPNCYVMPGSSDLTPEDPKFSRKLSKETLIKRIVNAVRPQFDLVLLDPPPGLSTITLSVLAASDFYLIPMGFDRSSLEGVAYVKAACKRVQDDGIGNPKFLGAFCTQYGQPRHNATKDFDKIASKVEGVLHKLHIPKSSHWTQAEMRSATMQSKRNHPISIGYQKLTKYIAKEIRL